MNLSAYPRKPANFFNDKHYSLKKRRVRVVEISKNKLSVQIIHIPPNSMLQFLKLNIWWTSDSPEPRHMNARVCGKRRHTCLQPAKGEVSRQALTCPSKPTSFLPTPGISVLPQGPLRSPTVFLKLLLFGLTHNTSPSQLKAMPSCIPT